MQALIVIQSPHYKQIQNLISMLQVDDNLSYNELFELIQK